MNMGTMMKRMKRNNWLTLSLFYVLFVGIRFLLSVLTTSYPTVGIDEFLYYSLGRSIATEGSLLYRGQPAMYNYILYPLILSPVYMIFGEGADYYRILQLWNSIIMNTAIFPIFRMSQRKLNNQRSALVFSAGAMLLPDFMLSEFIFSEALLYPLFFIAVDTVDRIIRQPRNLDYVFLGVIGALLYYTKPGAICIVAVSCIILLIRSIRTQEGKAKIEPLWSIGGFIVAYFILWGVARFGFGYKGSPFSVYEEQLSVEGGEFAFFRSLLLYPYYFLLGCGIFPVYVAVTRAKQWSAKNRLFFLICTVSLAVMMVGTSWTINRPERSGNIFLRYIDMYIPLVCLACMIPGEVFEQSKKKRWVSFGALILLTILIAVSTDVFGSTSGVYYKFNNHYHSTVSILLIQNIAGISNIIIILGALFSLFMSIRGKDTKKITISCMSISVILFCANNVAGYLMTAGNSIPDYREEARNTQEKLIREEPYLYLQSTDMSTDAGLDLYSKHNNQKLELYDFYNNINQSGGVYVPFLPVEERGILSATMTDDVDVIVADKTVYPLIEFSENVQGAFSDYESFFVGRFDKGTRIVDSVMINVEKLTLLQNAKAAICVFKDEYLNHPLIIRMDIESPVEQDMDFASKNESFTGHLAEGRATYEIPISKPSEQYVFSVKDSSVTIYTYEIVPRE